MTSHPCACGCGQLCDANLRFVPGHNANNRRLAPPKHLKPLVRCQEALA